MASVSTKVTKAEMMEILEQLNLQGIMIDPPPSWDIRGALPASDTPEAGEEKQSSQSSGTAAGASHKKRPTRRNSVRFGDAMAANQSDVSDLRNAVKRIEGKVEAIEESLLGLKEDIALVRSARRKAEIDLLDSRRAPAP
uniref:Uncharacterized protein n=1 Tax=Tetraselmis sp. GSL018 TaxID=582737 RepID=A0A061QPJ4_9CHLO